MRSAAPLCLVILVGCSGSTYTGVGHEFRANDRMVDEVMEARAAFATLEPGLSALGDVVKARWQNSPDKADQRWREATQPVKPGTPEPKAETKPPYRFEFSEAEKEKLKELKGRLTPTDLRRAKPQALRLLRLAQAARSWQDVLMEDPEAAQKYRIVKEEVIGFHTDAPLGVVVLYRFAPR